MPSRIAFCVSLSKRYFFPLLTSWSFHLSSSLLGFITPGLGGHDPWISASLLGLLFPPGLYSMLFYFLEMPNFALLKSRVYRFWCVASSQPSISWTPQCDGYSSCNRMHIPHRSSWWEQGPAKHPLTISSSITWRRKLFLMHFRNFQQILGQVSPLGQPLLGMPLLQRGTLPPARPPVKTASTCSGTCARFCLPALLLVNCAPQGCSLWAWGATPFLLAPCTPHLSHERWHFLTGLSTAWGFPRSGPLPSPIC